MARARLTVEMELDLDEDVAEILEVDEDEPAQDLADGVKDYLNEEEERMSDFSFEKLKVLSVTLIED